MRVIFLCHEAKRTGVPLLLLELVRWLKVSYQVEPFIVFVKGGPLVTDFEMEAKIFVWNRRENNTASRRHGGMLRNMIETRTRRLWLAFLVKKFRADLLYVNTVAALSFLQRNKDIFQSCKTILHCHEMPFSINRYVPPSLKHLFSRMAGIIVVNRQTKRFFFDSGKAASQILHIPEYHCRRFPSSEEPFKSNSGTFTVLSVGLGSWRKGIDLFVLSAYYFAKRYSKPFVFTWVGSISPDTLQQLIYDVRVLGLSERIKFVGEANNPEEYFTTCDAFFLSSREDPYPLVMLEAAWFEKPIVYFRGTGGADEFLDDSQLSVEPFDVDAVAERLVNIAENGGAFRQKTKELKLKASSHTIETIGPYIYKFISRTT